jgi:FixJ family two-component response regulator
MASRVFLVDGDLSARRGLARLLRTTGHDVREFASASELLDSLHPETSGCLVLDAGTPGLSGAELLAQLEARQIDLPVIVISAGDEPEIRRRAYAMNAAGFFRKPVDGTALLDAIAWTLRSTRPGAVRKSQPDPSENGVFP